MSQNIDYRTVEIPAEKSAAELSYAQRRAEILSVMQRAGHPRRVRQADLAEKYDVNQSTISRDLDALAGYIDDGLGDRRAFVSSLVFNRAITGLLEEEEWRAAAQTVKDMNEWIENYRELEALDERLTEIEEQQERAKYR
jgi:hypothetical protein